MFPFVGTSATKKKKKRQPPWGDLFPGRGSQVVGSSDCSCDLCTALVAAGDITAEKDKTNVKTYVSSYRQPGRENKTDFGGSC